jgi:ribosomal protein L37AE/L43A
MVCVSIYVGTMIIISTNKREGKWGINTDTDKLVCPKCGKKALENRKPYNLQQLLWGGWTCKNCGCVVDKWGKEIRKE